MAEIVCLGDYPHFAPVVAQWRFDQWGRNRPGVTLERVLSRVQEEMNCDRIPVCLLALVDGQPAGTAALRERDLDTHPGITPWLGSVFVPAEHRERGIGSQLAAAVEALAGRLGIQRLYLFTPDKEHFYARLGWQVLEHAVFREQAVVVMAKDLG